MNSITTEWLLPEKIKEYKEALSRVNVSRLCKKHNVHHQVITRVLEGKTKQASAQAKVALLLSDALAEYREACKILEEMTQKHIA